MANSPSVQWRISWGGGLVLHNPIIFGNFLISETNNSMSLSESSTCVEQEGDMTFVCSFCNVALQERMLCKRSSEKWFVRLHNPATQRFMLCVCELLLWAPSQTWPPAWITTYRRKGLNLNWVLIPMWKFQWKLDFAFLPRHQCLFSDPTSPR